MTRTTLFALGAVLLAACADESTAPLAPGGAPSLSRAGGAFSFTPIRVPDARATTAFGVNAGGDVVGAYVDAGGATHGFLLRGGVFTTIDYPDAAFTQARGIGPGGEIVGSYRLPDDDPVLGFHGFMLTRQGEFVQVDYPGHLYTIPQRILPDGTILGCYHDDDFMETMRGIAIGRDGNSETDAFASMHNGATPDLRRIAGLYTNMAVGPTGRTEGYVIDDGEFKPFLVPGSRMTAAWDVNPLGQVAGVYQDAAGRFHGFVRTADDYLSVDVPGAVHTRAFGINARGDVVGHYVAGGKVYGFLARRTGGQSS